MVLRKPSDFFGRDKKVEETKLPVVKSDNSLREELNKVEILSGQLQQLQQDIAQKVVKSDLESLVLSQINTMQENFVTLQREVKQSNKTDLGKFKEVISEITEIVNNLVEDEIPKYKKQITSNEVRLSNQFTDFKEEIEERVEKFYQVLNEFNDVVQVIDTVSNIEKYLQEHHQDLLTLREEVFAEIEQIPVGNIQENLERLEAKIDFIRETYSAIDSETVAREIIQEGLLNEPPETKNEDPLTPLDQNFVTLDQLQEHYRLFINRIQQQLSTLGGGGETRLKYLDDIVGIATNASYYDGMFLSYDHTLGKFKFKTVTGGGGSSLSVSERLGIAGSNVNEVNNVTALRFDSNSGFNVTDLGSGEVFVDLGSTFNPWYVNGEQTLKATGEEPIEFISGPGIAITTKAVASVGIGTTFSKAITITATGIGSYANVSGISTVSQGLTGVPNIRVGFTTITGVGNTALVVNGDVRITGILTIGTSSLTLNGNNNTIKVGTGLTITEDGNANYSGIVTAKTFSGNATSATYATTSGVSTYSSSSGISTYATTAGIATYATIAGISTLAGTATTATNLSDAANILTGTINKDRISTTNSLTVLGDLYVSNNISFGGTTTQLNTQQLQIADPDIVLGIGTSFSPNDNTANHGGIAIASTEGTPLVSLNIVPGETNPTTYKKIMWFKGSTIGAGITDAWLFNYAVGIGSTNVPNGVRLAVGNIQLTDNTITAGTFTGSLSGNATSATTATTSSYASNSGISTYSSRSGIATYSTTAGIATNATTAGYATTAGISTVAQGLTGTPNITVGIVTATSYNGSGATLTGVITSLVAGTNVTIVQSSGIATINASGGGGGSQTLDQTLALGNSSTLGMSVGVTTVTNLNVTGIATIGTGIVTTLRGTNINYTGISTFTSTFATNVNVSGIATIGTGIVTTLRGTTLNYTGVSTFSSGPVLISSTGTATTTGTASQPLQVTGGAYVSGSVGVGTTNPRQTLDVIGTVGVQGVGSTSRFYIQHNTAQNSLDFVFI